MTKFAAGLGCEHGLFEHVVEFLLAGGTAVWFFCGREDERGQSLKPADLPPRPSLSASVERVDSFPSS